MKSENHGIPGTDSAVIPLDTNEIVVRSSIEVSELLEAFLSEKSPKTVEAYRRDLEEFRKFLDVTDMDKAAKVFLGNDLAHANHLALKYKTFLVDDKKLQPTTVNRKLAALRSLTDMAYTLGMITWRVRVKEPKGQRESS
jgi:integrase/recombinase XerC